MKLSRKFLLLSLSLSAVVSLYSMNSYAHEKFTRYSWHNRVETSLETLGLSIVNRSSSNDQKNKDIVIADGYSFADSLSAINLVKSKNADILLTPTYGNSSVSKLAKNAENIYVVGGEKTLPKNNVLAAINGKAISKPVVKKPVKSNEKLIKIFGGTTLLLRKLLIYLL